MLTRRTRKPIYVVAYDQSNFGKLFGMSVSEILTRAVFGACDQIKATPSMLDVGSVGAACNIALNQQGLLAGLLAAVPGMESKPIETVEAACASGGQAILSVIYKLLSGLGETGIAVGYEKMRDASGKCDAELVGKALGYYAHPNDRTGKTLVFPHIFGEIMSVYMKDCGVTERDLAHVSFIEYENARYNPWAQMKNVRLTLDDMADESERNRYVVPGLPLKTYDCSQVTDGWASVILATKAGLKRLGVSKHDCVEVAGYAQATDPLEIAGRNVLCPVGAHKAMARAYNMAGLCPADVNIAEVHDCFSVMGAIGVEVIGQAEVGLGARYWAEGKARIGGECAINTSGGLIAKGHPVGATGIAMIGWATLQILGKAPKELQVKAPRCAATFNIGGPICSSVCTVLRAA